MAKLFVTTIMSCINKSLSVSDVLSDKTLMLCLLFLHSYMISLYMLSVSTFFNFFWIAEISLIALFHWPALYTSIALLVGIYSFYGRGATSTDYFLCPSACLYVLIPICKVTRRVPIAPRSTFFLVLSSYISSFCFICIEMSRTNPCKDTFV